MQSIHSMIIKLVKLFLTLKKKTKKEKRMHESSLPMSVPTNVNPKDLNDINIGISPDMMHDTNTNSGINNIAGVEAEAQPPILICIHPVPSETQTLQGYNPGENQAQPYVITSAFFNYIQTKKKLQLILAKVFMEKETDENSDGIAALSNDVTTGNDISNATGNGVDDALFVERYVWCSLL